MSENNLLDKKYPFLGYSPNIIEYFGIIGYNEKYVPQMLNNFTTKQIATRPTILSSITSNSDFGLVDNDLIIDQIYPDNPIPILINKNDPNQEVPPISKVIYSFCFDSTDGTKKLFHVCFSYKFHEKYISDTNEEYYIPKAFCIVSQYFYFNLFNYICKNIYAIMSKDTYSVPIELTIYNIVNFIPSPIKYKYNLNLFDLDVPDIEIGQLTGYPYLDFDLSQIFNLLPLNLVLEIFILTLLETSMLFFSSNLELLNMVMFIMYILNYPCNDSTYFWHIVSVSKKNFVQENKFVGKLMVSMLGYNETYNEEIDTSAFGSNHFIVDLDNKKLFLNNKDLENLEEDDVIENYNLQNLLNYFENIINKKEKIPDNSFVKSYILKLKKSLEVILSKNPDNPEYTSSPKNKFVDFFKMSRNIGNINKSIQETFYDFCLNILMLFFQDNCFNTSFDKLKKDESEEILKRLNKFYGFEESTKMSKEDYYFFYLFRSSIKYKIYFENFIQNMEAIDVFKIPLLFSEEFINIKIKNSNNRILDKISLFSIIDSFYLENKGQVINITLNNIIGDYAKLKKNYFKQFYEKENFGKKEKEKSEKKKKLITLNKKIINQYIYILNNIYNEDQLKALFPSTHFQTNDPISKANMKNIIKFILDSFEQKNIIENPNYLIYGFVFVFAIAIPLYSFQKMYNHLNKLKNILVKLKLFSRQLTYILVKTFYKFYLIHKKKKIYPHLSISNIKIYFFMLINEVLRENFMIPNEEMMKIFTEFFSRIIYQERDSINNKKNEGIDDEANFIIERNKNFTCFIKHCFTAKKIIKPQEMIMKAVKENKNDNIILTEGKNVLKPVINIKINDYFYSSYLFSPKKIYKLSQSTYNDFFDKELDMSKLNIKNLRDIITNLIEYSLHLKINEEIIPFDYLVYTLYLLRNHEKKYTIKNK